MPLELTSTYHLPGEPAGFRDYGRYDNATWDAVEEMLAHLEAAPCVAFPSAMAAITAVMFSQLKAGDRVLLPADGYRTTRMPAEC